MSMMERVLELPDQLRWGLDLEPQTSKPASSVLLVGMGGSGMAARVGKLVADSGRVQTAVYQGYGLPAWVAESKPHVIAVSHSGNTEETLSSVERATDLGLPLSVVAAGGRLGDIAADVGAPFIEVPGGMMPRAALGYQSAAVLRLLEGAGAIADPRPALEEAADIVSVLLGSGDGAGFRLGADLAEGLAGRIAVIYAPAGVGSLAASRWKAQINENAKMPAYANEMPELNHNEIEGWGTLRELTQRAIATVFLTDPAAHERVRLRMRLTVDLLDGMLPSAGSVVAQGRSSLARLFSLIAVGDVASVVLAEQAGIDPTPIPVLEAFKQKLAGP